MGTLTPAQVAQLLEPIKTNRIKQANGQSHLPAYDVAAHLTRLFGFGGWDTENCVYTVLFEDFEERTRTNNNVTTTYKVWTIGYSASIRLVIKDENGVEVAHYENGACGDAINQPSRADAHHLAMTTAISTALKRCAAFGLGDQFGLSLYNKGNLGPLIVKTIVLPSGTPVKAQDLESHIATPESLGNDERQIENDGDGANKPIETGGATQKEEKQPEGDGATQQEQKQGGATTGDFTEKQKEIKAHPKYTAMPSANKGKFLSDHAGYEVKNIKQLHDDDCEQILAALRAL